MPKKYDTVIYLGSTYLLRVTERKNTLANVLTLRGTLTYGVSVEEWEFWDLYLWWPCSILHCSFESVAFVVNNRAAERMARVPKMPRWKFPWHAAFTALPNFFFLCPTSIPVLWRACVHTHISDWSEIVYELPLLPNNTASETNLKRCEVLTGYLSLGCRPGGDWANTWHWAKVLQFSFQTGSSSTSSYCHILFLIVFLEQAVIRNIIIIIIIIVIRINYNMH